ncbi:hypothetical protein BD65_2384 [Yersinia ruckeri]|uniref:hypothetical protein n=1 Tax=Yersinia ruckeri TaxID=29486 RepID=UPI0005ACB54E|nr:hypothetical protein [Yersinia ruckeri]AJI94836.1 hypothetical protein BD65_2384 [Yersinia ruckeri]MCW6568886.1 hypothetical protein [Yersinia ruckeri]
MLHGQFDHSDAGQTDGVLRHLFIADIGIQSADAKLRPISGQFQPTACFRLWAVTSLANMAYTCE